MESSTIRTSTALPPGLQPTQNNASSAATGAPARPSPRRASSMPQMAGLQAMPNRPVSPPPAMRRASLGASPVNTSPLAASALEDSGDVDEPALTSAEEAIASQIAEAMRTYITGQPVAPADGETATPLPPEALLHNMRASLDVMPQIFSMLMEGPEAEADDSHRFTEWTGDADHAASPAATGSSAHLGGAGVSPPPDLFTHSMPQARSSEDNIGWNTPHGDIPMTLLNRTHSSPGRIPGGGGPASPATPATPATPPSAPTVPATPPSVSAAPVAALPAHTNTADSARPPAHAATLPPLNANTPEEVADWMRNAKVVVGHRLVSVGIATAVREAVGAGMEAAMAHPGASDKVKNGLAATMMGVVIAANLGTIAYRLKKASLRNHSGNGLQAAALSATMTTALIKGSMKDLVPSLTKVGAYAGVRDITTLLYPLTNNLGDNPHPMATTLINSAVYVANQFLVNTIQGYGGMSGASFYDAFHSRNETMSSSQKWKEGAIDTAKLGVYSLANTLGEVGDTIVPALIQHRLQHGTFEGIANIAFTTGYKTPEDGAFLNKMMDDIVPRLSLFDSVYAGTSAIDPHVNAHRFGDAGSNMLQNFSSALMIATLCIPYAMVGMKKVGNAINHLRGDEAV